MSHFGPAVLLHVFTVICIFRVVLSLQEVKVIAADLSRNDSDTAAHDDDGVAYALENLLGI